MATPGVLCDGNGSDGGSDTSSVHCRRIIVVANMLPLNAHKDNETGKWCFSFDEDSIYVQAKDGLPDTDFLYIGSLKAEIDPSEEEEVAEKLLEEFSCVPTFLPSDIQEKFYQGFCKHHLWSIFHYLLPISPNNGELFNRGLWTAYVTANKIFASKVVEVINPEDDLVWIHDYHLLIVPTYLRERYVRLKLGFFLHSPFPSSEIFRTLPVRDEILRGLLNSDLIGFHTFDYARHFLSCCGRMLGLEYASKRGHLGLEYFGRTVYIKILPVGIHVGRLESVLRLPSTAEKVREIQSEFQGKNIILGVDDLDIFKGITLKLLAFERLLETYPRKKGKLVLVQIVNPARTSGKDIEVTKTEMYSIANRINEAFGSSNHKPVVFIDRPVDGAEKSAYYAMADCCIVNAVRDGMNLVPYKYVVCRQNSIALREATDSKKKPLRTSPLVVSEFIGCTPSLSGALRANPWDVESVASALATAITMQNDEKQLRHENHYRYVSCHDVSYWSRTFLQDLERACQDHYIKRCWGMGLGLNFRVLTLDPTFRRLENYCVAAAYEKSSKRAFFLDYDGTVVPESPMREAPNSDVVAMLDALSSDPKNIVFIVSGRDKASLGEWLGSCENLGIAAEHGYFLRWNKNAEWESLSADLDWKATVEPIMRQYTETTDGSFMEIKESAIVWNHEGVGLDFGTCQAKELLDHLESVLANEPVIVKRGQHIVECKPQGVTKGWVAQKVLAQIAREGDAADFVFCAGDDRSDEDMFETIQNPEKVPATPKAPEVFACTVGQKPSKAQFYLEDSYAVVGLLNDLVTPRVPVTNGPVEFTISGEGY